MIIFNVMEKSKESNKYLNDHSNNLENCELNEEKNNQNINKNKENDLNNNTTESQQSIKFSENAQKDDIQRENNIKSNLNTEEEEGTLI